MYTAVKETASSESEHRISVSGVLKYLGVSRSGYYDWLSRTPSNQAIMKAKVKDEIKSIYDDSYCIYGAPKITAQLHKKGFRCYVLESNQFFSGCERTAIIRM